MTSIHPRIEELTVESLGGLGDGIATLDGKPVFISKSCAGDHLRVRIVHENRDGYQAHIEEVIAAGTERRTPPCSHFSECGGCTMQQLQESAYESFKTRMFHSALSNAGIPLPDAKVIFVGAHSRRRAEFKLCHDEHGVRLSFNAPRSHTPVALDSCLTLLPALHNLLSPLNQELSSLPQPQSIKSVSLTAADSGVDMLISFHELYKKSDFQINWADIAERLGIARISFKYPEGRIEVVAQTSPVEMQLGSYNIPLPTESFLQATSEGQLLLTDAVLKATEGARTAVDLFCGIGSYSFPLCDSIRTHAVEGDAGMIRNLQQTAKNLGINTLTAEKRDLFKQPLTIGELRKFDAAIINPPRVGAKAQVEALSQSNVGTIVMVSCNPASFARDAKTLHQTGFRLESAFGVDQFVWSQHLEIVAIFRR